MWYLKQKATGIWGGTYLHTHTHSWSPCKLPVYQATQALLAWRGVLVWACVSEECVQLWCPKSSPPTWQVWTSVICHQSYVWSTLNLNHPIRDICPGTPGVTEANLQVCFASGLMECIHLWFPTTCVCIPDLTQSQLLGAAVREGEGRGGACEGAFCIL